MTTINLEQKKKHFQNLSINTGHKLGKSTTAGGITTSALWVKRQIICRFAIRKRKLQFKEVTLPTYVYCSEFQWNASDIDIHIR